MSVGGIGGSSEVPSSQPLSDSGIAQKAAGQLGHLAENLPTTMSQTEMQGYATAISNMFPDNATASHMLTAAQDGTLSLHTMQSDLQTIQGDISQLGQDNLPGLSEMGLTSAFNQISESGAVGVQQQVSVVEGFAKAIGITEVNGTPLSQFMSEYSQQVATLNKDNTASANDQLYGNIPGAVKAGILALSAEGNISEMHSAFTDAVEDKYPG